MAISNYLFSPTSENCWRQFASLGSVWYVLVKLSAKASNYLWRDYCGQFEINYLEL